MRKKRKKQVNAPVGSATFERRMERQRARPMVTVRLTSVKVKTLVIIKPWSMAEATKTVLQ